MIIGVDGGALSVGDERLKVGVYKVTIRFLEHISQIDNSNNYRIYTFNTIGEWNSKRFGKKIEAKKLPRIGWQKLWLSLELELHSADVFLGFSQMLPESFFSKQLFHSLSRRRPIFKIGFVHDIGFLTHPECYPNTSSKLKIQTDKLVKRSDIIIAVSEATKHEILAHYDFPANRIAVCYEGVDGIFTPRGEVYRSPRPYFLFVGALKKQKNIPMLIRAFWQFLTVTKKTYDLLLVGGDYWFDQLIKKTIDQLNLHERVKIIGYVHDSDLPKYYRGAISFVSPSLVEGFCLPVAEAMASGCPVICSNIGAFPEIVGEAGILVDPTDVNMLAKEMMRVSENRTLVSGMKKRGMIKSKQYTWQAFAANVYGTYKDLLTTIAG